MTALDDFGNTASDRAMSRASVYKPFHVAPSLYAEFARLCRARGQAPNDALINMMRREVVKARPLDPAAR